MDRTSLGLHSGSSDTKGSGSSRDPSAAALGEQITSLASFPRRLSEVCTHTLHENLRVAEFPSKFRAISPISSSFPRKQIPVLCSLLQSLNNTHTHTHTHTHTFVSSGFTCSAWPLVSSTPPSLFHPHCALINLPSLSVKLQVLPNPTRPPPNNPSFLSSSSPLPLLPPLPLPHSFPSPEGRLAWPSSTQRSRLQWRRSAVVTDSLAAAAAATSTGAAAHAPCPPGTLSLRRRVRLRPVSHRMRLALRRAAVQVSASKCREHSALCTCVAVQLSMCWNCASPTNLPNTEAVKTGSTSIHSIYNSRTSSGKFLKFLFTGSAQVNRRCYSMQHTLTRRGCATYPVGYKRHQAVNKNQSR